MRKYMIFLFIIILITGSWKPVFGESLREVQAKRGEVVTAYELFNSFDMNPIAAMIKYKSTGVIIHGIIYNIAVEQNGGHIAIALNAGVVKNKLIILFFNKNKSNIEEISKLKKEQHIIAHGYPQNRLYENGWSFVQVTNCSIIDDNYISQEK